MQNKNWLLILMMCLGLLMVCGHKGSAGADSGNPAPRENSGAKASEAVMEAGSKVAEKAGQAAESAGGLVKESGGMAASAAAEWGTKSVMGIKRGFNNALEFPIEITPELVEASGISAAYATITSSALSDKHILNSYIIFEKPYTGTLQLRVYNKEGREIGRSEVLEIEAGADDARNFDFYFDKRTSMTKLTGTRLYGQPAEPNKNLPQAASDQE